jgi:predicted nucleic acid-binding protein
LRVYVDSSAAAKLVSAEAETSALQGFLSDVGSVEILSSELLETELRRTASRQGASQGEVSDVLSRIDLLAAPRGLFHEAGLLQVPRLRSLDAIHLATALRIEATVLVTYDRRLSDAAEVVGIPAVGPA